MPILEQSVKSLLIQMQFNDAPLGTGTGFIVETQRGAVLITNRHNVTGRHNISGNVLSTTGGIPNRISIVHNQINRLGNWIQKQESILDNNDNPLWIEHPTLGATADFVALPLTQLDEVQLYPYSLENTGPAIKILPADVVSVVGFPFGLTGGGSLAIWATGFIATEHDINYEGQPKFLIDCRARPGQSGSAVIAQRNGGSVAMQDDSMAMFGRPVTKFLGIYSGRINEQSDLGIVWKASAIKELIDSIHL
ncbi:MAG: trypsin-like peptidase domain-containing protein [Bacteroidetes bacterium]|nr:trypsin-like peptidase domain-containing protein [Bacteroidota bacterium]